MLSDIATSLLPGSLLGRPMRKRRDVLEQNMTEIPRHVMFSEVNRIQKPEELHTLTKKVFDEGLEGLVLKDANVLPDFVVRDPKQSPVWEVIGAEFSRAEMHTADGISIRFPRIQKFRDDKTWKEATDLPRLKLLYAESKKKSDLEVPGFSRKPSGEGSDDGGSDDGGSDDGNYDDDVEEDNSCTDLNISSSKESTPSKALKKISSEAPNSPKNDHPEPTGKSPTKITSYLQKSVSPTKAPEQPSKSPAKASRKKLQSTFHGCKIILSRTTADFRHLRRYIIAFDGDLLPEYDVHTATHIITTDRSQVTEKGEKTQLVTPDWLWKCIRRGRLVSTDAFTPS